MSESLNHLTWDSNHFGIPVYQAKLPAQGSRGLMECLSQAKSLGAKLVYLSLPLHSEAIAPEVLDRFGGQLVDQRVEFKLSLDSFTRDRLLPFEPPEELFGIEPYPQTAASEPLLRLGIAAGEHSRFQADPRIPRERFETLYRTWMERSAKHELADLVLVAQREQNLVGAITVSTKEDAARIGLIAVDRQWRGQGIGRQLMVAAHRWMLERQLSATYVVTQHTNAAACSLYRRMGYEIWQSENIYHFWL